MTDYCSSRYTPALTLWLSKRRAAAKSMPIAVRVGWVGRSVGGER